MERLNPWMMEWLLEVVKANDGVWDEAEDRIELDREECTRLPVCKCEECLWAEEEMRRGHYQVKP